jgi:hypothetical protein
MSASHSNKGKSIILVVVIKNIELKYNTVGSLRKELQISDRSINRGILDGKLHNTKSLKYPLVLIKKI